MTELSYQALDTIRDPCGTRSGSRNMKARIGRFALPSRMDDRQVEECLERIEISIAMEQRVTFAQAERGD